MARITRRLMGFASAAAVTVVLTQGAHTATGSTGAGGWRMPPPDGGTITISAVGTALNVAPYSAGFSVDLSASDFDTPAPANGTSYDRQFHELEYYWTFGDAGEWAAPVNVLAAHKNRNFAYGPYARHMYRTPGVKTITVMVVEPSSGKVSTAETTITVGDPATVYAGSRTICVNPVGDTDFSEAPAGATHIQAANVYDGGTVDAAIDALGGGAFRVMFKRGWDGIVSWTTSDYPVTHAAFCRYGSTGAIPILRARSDDVLSNRVINLSDPGGDSGRPDVRVYDVWARGTFDETTEDPQFVAHKQEFISGLGNFNVIMHNLDVQGFGQCAYGHQQGAQTGTSFHADDCVFANIGGQYGIFFATDSAGPNRRVSLTGVRYAKSQGSLASEWTRALLRFGSADYAYIRGCDLFQTDPSQPVIKLSDSVARNGEQFIVQTTSFEGVGLCVVAVGLNSSESFDGKGPLLNGLIESCVIVGGYKTQGMVAVYGGGGVSLRNNLMIQPAMTRMSNSLMGFVRLLPDFSNPARADWPTRIYNNTFVNLRSDAQNVDPGPVPDVTPTDAPTRASYGITVVANNVVHQPNCSSPVTTDAPLTTTQLWTARNIGHTDPTTKVLDGTYASPAGSVPESKPSTGSAAIGSATGTVTLIDLLGRIRPGTLHPDATAGTPSAGALEPA